MDKPRLIDIKELQGCAIIRPMSHEDMVHINSCSNRINHNEIPTAYDIDKVVEQLEVYRASSRGAYEDAIVSSDMRLGIATRNQEVAFIKAIEIVKGGVEWLNGTKE